MSKDLKPMIITGLFLSAAAALFWAASPDLSPVAEQPYAELVLVFTSVVAATSLYFIHQILSEVIVE